MAYFKGDFRSSVLERDTGLGVILPYDRPAEAQQYPCPVVYLLHGLGNNASSWVRHSNVERYARNYGVAVVMPEVEKSFYTDMVMGSPYFTYLTKELPALCGEMFRLSSRREDTFIAGLSMGGYGALKAGLTYPEQYAGVASFSGVLDLDYIKEAMVGNQKNEAMAVWGNDLEVSSENDLYHLLHQWRKKEKEPQKIYLSCGTEDFLFGVNTKYSDYLTQNKVEHTFETWAGNHEWEFWDRSIQRAFEEFFANKL